MRYRHQDLVELGQAIAEDGVRRHERALLELAFRVQTQAPGAAAALADRNAPSVLRERAFSVAADALARTATEPPSWPRTRAGGATAVQRQQIQDVQGHTVGSWA